MAGYLLDRIAPRFAQAGILAGHVVLMVWILNTDSPAMAVGMGALRGLSGAFEGIVGGVAYDYFGGYRAIILLMMLLPAAGAVAALFAPRPVRQAMQD